MAADGDENAAPGQAEARQPEPVLRPRGVRSRLRRLVIAALGLSLAAVLAGCVLLGWLLNGWLRSEPPPRVAVTVTRPVTVLEAETQQVGSMPGLLGLDEATARQVLLDAGIDVESVSTKEQPYAGVPRLVVDQAPAAGTQVGPDGIVLTLSRAATVPQLVGADLTEARDALAELGASVRIETRYEPEATENAVLETDPAAGAPLTGSVAIVVAEPASSVFLTELDPIDSNCYSETLNVAGQERPDALVCKPYDPSYPRAAEYLLNGRVASFVATLGLGDRGAADPPVTFRVFLDGQLKFEAVLKFGREKTIEIPAVGALRLRIETAVTSSDSSGGYVLAVFGDARLLGGRAAIDDLVAESSQ